MTGMVTGPVPAIAGAAQVIQRPEDWSDPSEALGPIELMVQAARDAASDAGPTGLLGRVDWVGVVGGLWSYRDPGRLVAREIGVPDARTALSAISGSAPQQLVGLAAERIASGEIDVALIVGGEATAARRRLREAGEPRQWISDSGEGEPEMVGGFAEEMLDEMRVVGVAATAYALLDDSLRLRRGQPMTAHRDEIAALWERFSAVAAGNPFAWDRSQWTTTAIREPGPDNRMIAFPYTKALVANNTVDMASALLLCSEAAARSAGVATGNLVFPHVSASSHDTWRIATRDRLHETPALAAAGRAALEYAGIADVGEITHLDLYACFPAIVRMSTACLAIDPQRQLTVTGGLGFAGAPLANSSGQAIAAMVPLLRAGGSGLVHANGGTATTHAVGVYSAEPPARGFARLDVQPEVDLRPRAAAAPDSAGDGDVEAATVVFDRDGPSHVVASLINSAGARSLVRSTDADLIDLATRDGLGGMSGPLPGGVHLSRS
jgi:acetyl-CoA C-acetyltransferase